MRAFFVLFLSCVALFSETPMPESSRSIAVVATVLSVHDGDTLSLAIGGALQFVGPVRLKAVRAKELGSAGGIGARAHLLRLTPVGSVVRVQFSITHDGNFVRSLCRPIAEIWNEVTGDSINEQQVSYLKANNWWGGRNTQ